jgi:hypothetical protein
MVDRCGGRHGALSPDCSGTAFPFWGFRERIEQRNLGSTGFRYRRLPPNRRRMRRDAHSAVHQDYRSRCAGARELPKTYLSLNYASVSTCKYLINWRSLRDSNSCYSLERAIRRAYLTILDHAICLKNS